MFALDAYAHRGPRWGCGRGRNVTKNEMMEVLPGGAGHAMAMCSSRFGILFFILNVFFSSFSVSQPGYAPDEVSDGLMRAWMRTTLACVFCEPLQWPELRYLERRRG